MFQPFDEKPATYVRMAVLSALCLFLYLAGGFALFKFLLHGENWLSNWRFFLIAALLLALFARMHYRSMTSLDTHRLGRGWEQKEVAVKLPYEKVGERAQEETKPK